MKTVGILYPGDMRHSVGKVLRGDGFPVVTSLFGRSERTRRLSRSAHFDECAGVDSLVDVADVILSIVPPAASLDVAGQVATAAQDMGKSPLFVEANAVSPMTVSAAKQIVLDAGCPFLDACIIGPANDVRGRCVFYVSGTNAAQFVAVFDKSLAIHVLGDREGEASAFKMLFSGLNKGLVSVFSELIASAHQYGFIDDLLDCYRQLFPGIMDSLDWLVPTYPFHAARRAEEMGELAATLEYQGLSSVMARGMEQTLSAMGALELSRRFPQYGETEWTLATVVQALAVRDKPDPEH